MRLIRTTSEMRRFVKTVRSQGKTIGLVPTMGCLHEGHLSLMRKAKECADVLIVTIFVNPMQFGPNEDFSAYPRQLEQDCDAVAKEGAAAVFAPDDGEMYPENFQTTVNVAQLSQGMCGGNRPGHFDGVATVVAKLFNIVGPDYAVFGQKDFQQVALLRQMSADLNFPVQIIGCPIVREADGLAMSSRNKYLQGEDRIVARCLFQAINQARELVAAADGSVKATELIEQSKRVIAKAGAVVDYCVVVDEHDLSPHAVINRHSLLALAVKVGGKVRLIDNGKLIVD